MSTTLIRNAFEKIAGPVVPPAIKTLPVKIRIDADPADRIIAYAYEKFESGTWFWLQGAWMLSPNVMCVQQALQIAGRDLNLRDSDTTEAVVRVLNVIDAPSIASIPVWNDSTRTTYGHVLNVLEKAMVGVRAA